MFDKLEDLVLRLEEVLNQLSEPDVASDAERFRKLMKEQSDLTPIVEAYKEYKQKVTQLYGEDADKTVKESVAKDKYEKDDIKLGDESRLFYDDFSGRYFESTLEKVLLAEYELNKEFGRYGYAYLNRFYELLGITQERNCKALGWSQEMIFDMYSTYFIEFDHPKVVMDDGLECYILSFCYDPVVDFENY